MKVAIQCFNEEGVSVNWIRLIIKSAPIDSVATTMEGRYAEVKSVLIQFREFNPRINDADEIIAMLAANNYVAIEDVPDVEII